MFINKAITHSAITNPRSICVLRLSAIGDVCHAVAAVQAIQQRYPDAKITWIIGKIESILLQSMSNIRFVVFDKTAGIRGYKDLRKSLAGERFDLLLHMQVALRASIATLFISAKEKWGFDRSRAKEGQWLFTNRRIAAQQSPHVVDGFLGFAKAIGVDQNLIPSWNMPLSETEREWRNETTGTTPYIVISPAASKQERNWLPSRYAEIARYAIRKGYNVILSGGPSNAEKQLANVIIQQVEKPLQNLVGRTSLPQLLALLEGARLVIAPDSGPAHMATTVNTPVVGLYAHSNPQRTGPYNSLATTVSIYSDLLLEQTGKSIKQNPWGKRVKGKELMEQITLAAVKKAFDQAIRKG
jgi:heptosyltransferase I